MKKFKKNPVCALLWADAAYSFEESLPKKPPLPQLTLGFIVEANDVFTHIVTTAGYDTSVHSLKKKDGILIPSRTIINFRKIGYYNEQE